MFLNHPIRPHNFQSSSVPTQFFDFHNHSWRLSGRLPAGCLSEDRVHIAQHDQVFHWQNFPVVIMFMSHGTTVHVLETFDSQSSGSYKWWWSVWKGVNSLTEFPSRFGFSNILSQSKSYLSLDFQVDLRSYQIVWHLDNKFPLGCFHWKGGSSNHEGDLLGR